MTDEQITADNVKMRGNMVVDERLDEAQRNQMNTLEARMNRVEAEVFPVEDDDDSKKKPSPSTSKSSQSLSKK